MKKSKFIQLVLCGLLFVSALFSACGKEPSEANNTPNMQGLVEAENFVSIQQTQQPTTQIANPTEVTSTQKAATNSVTKIEAQTTNSQTNPYKETYNPQVNKDNLPFTLEGIATLSADNQDRTSGGIIVRSYDELKATVDYDAFTSCIYQAKNGKRHNSFVDAFNAAFFERKALIIVYDLSTGGTYSAIPTHIKTQGTQAEVKLTKQRVSDGLGGTADIQYLRYFISVDKDEITGIKTVASTKA